MELLFLGSGTSAGVPMIGCHCPVCTSPDPRDQRSRASVLIRYHGPMHDVQVLIDTAPELRLQMIRHRIDRLDAVLFTHNHADHVFGLDDLRRFNAVMGTPMPIYAETKVLQWLHNTFQYIFQPHRNINDSFIPQLLTHPLEAGSSVELHGALWTAVRLLHGRLPILGFRVDLDGTSIGYCTDVSSFPPEAYSQLAGLDVLVIDALRYRHHPTHMTVDQALEQIEQLKPGRAYLTHIAHDICHAELEPQLPEHVYLAFDGLTVRTADRE